MNLLDGNVGEEYIIKEILTDDWVVTVENRSQKYLS